MKPRAMIRGRGRRGLLIAAIVAFLLCALLARGQPLRTLSSYLFAWLFFLGLSLGSLGALMMHHLTGGRWSAPVQRYFVAALAPLPLLALLFVPVALGMAQIFPWVGGHWADGDSAPFSAAYLTTRGCLVRSGVALITWCVLAWLLRTPAERKRAGALSAAGLLFYALTMSWAAVDWIASLEPHWSSSVLGLLVLAGQGLAAFALATLCATGASRNGHAAGADECGDLGNLLLTFVMTWMYLAFVQFLIIWAEDLPRETSWFFPRLQGGDWAILTFLVVAGQFVLPFVLLLFRRLKRDAAWLGRIALLVLVSDWLYGAWLILPTTQPAGPLLAVSDLAATAGVGGLWCLAFLHGLEGPIADVLSAEPRARHFSASKHGRTHGS